MPTQPSESRPPGIPMLPSNPLVMAANTALADPNFRAAVRQMHDEGYPLVKMVDALGLEDDMTVRIRTILEELPPRVVEGIRHATLDMLAGTTYMMPIDCTVTDAELESGVPIHVEVEPEEGHPTIHVRSTTTST